MSEANPRAAEQRPLAVAIAQPEATPDRPRLVAKGRGALAEQILTLAFAHGVKVREDADLAQMLDAVELDCEVPLPALAAVAEILTRVFQANAGASAPAQSRESVR